MLRTGLLTEVSRRLGNRGVVWAGIRGDDAEPLADLPQFAAAFSIVAAYRRRVGVDGVAYEDFSGVRVDPEIWDIDDHLHDDATVQFRQALLRSLARPSALLPYRSSRFLSAIWFARRDKCTSLGLFGAHQSAFEHKPWVETAVADLGLPHIRWIYVADEEQLQTRKLLDTGPIVLRRSRTSGGEGIVRVDSAAQARAQWPHVDEAFVSVAPYISGGVPVNVGATVWHDGVTLQHLSIQLVGIPGLVTREFGYCGNDFGLARDLDPVLVDQIEDAMTKIGGWLRNFGYRGTFGGDFLIHDGQALFTEINPRFQGSTLASCRLSVDEGEGCLMLEHLGAVLGMDAPARRRPLRDLVAQTPDVANVVVHWTGLESAVVDPETLVDAVLTLVPGSHADVLTHTGLRTDRGAAVARLTLPTRVTSTGFDVTPMLASIVETWGRRSGALPGQRKDPSPEAVLP